MLFGLLDGDTRRGLEELWPYWQLHLPKLLSAIACIMVGSMLQIALPLIGKDIASFEGDDAFDLSRRALLGIACIGSYHAISFLGHYRAFVGGTAVERSMLRAAMKAVMAKDFVEVTSVAPAERTTAIEAAAKLVSNLTADLLTDVVNSTITSIGYLCMVCYISTTLTVTFVAVAVGTQIFSKWYKATHGAKGDDVVLRDGQAHSVLLSALQRAALMRIFPDASKFVLESYGTALTTAGQARNHVDFIIHSNAAFTSGVTNSLFVTLIAALSYARARGLITTIDIVVFFYYIVQLQSHLQGLANQLNRMTVLLEQTKAFRDLLRTAPAESVTGAYVVPFEENSANAVAFEDISYSYAPNAPAPVRFAVHQVSLAIPCGTITAIVGQSGSGKTTLLRMLAGLLPPTLGRVRWMANGSVAMLEQSPALLLATIEDNIRVARPDATDAEIRVAASRSGCLDFIEALPEKFKTRVHNADLVQFSGGQLQRICLARVFLSRAPIVLFDEPTTGLDPQAAAVITGAMQQLKESNRTVIFITHALDQASVADTVVLMQNGCLMKRGTYAEVKQCMQ